MDEYEKTKIFTKRHSKLLKLLKIVYGYTSFRSKQYEIINKIINQQDVCAIMPTGMGKSLCYQIPALYINKPAIIISPLISLMTDQCMALKRLGISSCCYNSNVDNKRKLLKNISKGKYLMVYITPESIISMQELLVSINDKIGISLIAIDEAHCISSYGFDFRKAYRKITFFKEILPNVPILAVTATATKTVALDICKVLCFKKKNPICTSFDRPNLYLQISKKSKNMGNDIVPILKKHSNESIIIYCITRNETEKIAQVLKLHDIDCGVYHSGMSPKHRKKSHINFVNNKVKIMAATIAFAMGIDKPDVRSVIHYGVPRNLEGYYQEIGRAGRDGKKSYCYALYSTHDFHIQELMIESCNDDTYKTTLLRLFKQMKEYIYSKTCRRKILLQYFGEEYGDKCDFCDNCIGAHTNINDSHILTKQNVEKETKLFIELIESIKNKSFGVSMYINILRKSNNKNITPAFKNNKLYGTGKHRSIVWWRELAENLENIGFIQSFFVKTGNFPVKIIKITQKGLEWSCNYELENIFESDAPTILQQFEMTNTI